MPVVPLTLTISLCLVFSFLMFFLSEHTRGRVSSAERDSLLPLAEEESRLARAPLSTAVATPRQRSGDVAFQPRLERPRRG